MSPGPLPQFDRDEVLLRAMELFWEKGYQGTGITELLAHVGIGRQSLYNTFGNKRSLFLEALAAYKRVMIDELVEMLEAPGSPLGNVRHALRQRAAMVTDPEGFYGCMMGNSATEMGGSDPEVAEIIQAAMDRVVAAFEHAFIRAQEAGELRANVEPAALARFVVASFQGLAVIAQSNPDPDFVDRALDAFEALLAS